MEWGSNLAQYRARVPTCSVDGLVQLYKELKEVLRSASWAELSSASDELASLLNDLVESCPETLGSQLLGLLELLASNYSAEVSQAELTFVHVALAVHCWKHKFVECEHLKLFSAESRTLDPLDSEDVALYFENCYHLCAHSRAWTDAATHAALAFSLGASVPRFRYWYLAELIANGRVVALPRAVAPNVSCPVIAELARRFELTRTDEWHDLVEFCRHKEPVFEKWGVAQLARRALTTYCLLRIKRVLAHVVKCRANTLLDVYTQEGITLNELLGAGLIDFCEIDNGNIVSRAAQREDPEQAGLWLRTSAELSEQLQNEVYHV